MSTIPHGKLQKSLFFNLFVPALFFGLAICFMPLEQAFRFDNDEGLELIKASLYSEGFSLYTQIWNDQPPLLTVLLSHWFDLFGKSIFAGRLLILSFSTMLIWSFCQTLRLSLGSLSALVGTLLLVLSYQFLQLSVSVMFGLPALALAMLSVYTLMLHKRKPHKGLIVASGGLLALSLQTKLFTIFIIPLLIFELLDFRIREHERKEGRWSSILLWLGSLLAVFTSIGLLLHSLSYEQLLQANLGQNVKSAFENESLHNVILPMLLQDSDCLLLAILGILVVLANQQWEKIFPLVWLVTVILLLLNYKPVWYHYYLLFSIPLAWLAVYGATSAFNFLQRKRWHSNFKSLNLKRLLLSGLAAALLMLSIIEIPIKIITVQRENQASVEKYKLNTEIVDRLLEHKRSTRWVFTDLPIYAFYTGLRVPPEIAVFSRKRLSSGNLTVDQLLTVLRTYHPEQIILGRFPEIRDELSFYIRQNYSKTYEDSSITHYLLKECCQYSVNAKPMLREIMYATH
jgi:4-amino-4-deoxy-L-arabinose transferase-like glycosyltransferase